MNKLKLLLFLIVSTLLSSCGEEVLTSKTINEKAVTNSIQTFEVNTCSQMQFQKPPVDILYVIDNSGSTVASSFQDIKSEISNTIYNISKEFDYHVYFAPLNPAPNDSISGYPLIVSDPESLPSLSSVNLVSPESLNMFSQESGNNVEHGFTRAYNLINYNRSNGIFRENANTIIVMISNGDDTESTITFGSGRATDPQVFNSLKQNFQKLTKKYASANSVSNPLNAENFKFISLVAHQNCFDWSIGTNYKRMSKELFQYLNPSTDYVNQDTTDLCSSNYSSLFQVVNQSIRQVVVGHKYDHWKISSASSSSIQEDDITLTKISADGSRSNIPRDSNNGFEYLGYRSNLPTRYDPTVGEPQTGLIVKLNGNARIQYPECVIAKTRTPTEYFGYIAVPREPDTSTITVEIRGSEISQSSTNGWSYIGYRDTLNTKVPGPNNASVTPEVNKTGYFIKLNGNAIFTNGDTVNIFYKAKPL